MKEFIKKNKTTIILLIFFILLVIFTIFNYSQKKEVPKEEQQTEIVNIGNTKQKTDDDKFRLEFLHYKTINDREHQKIMLVFAKNVNDYFSNYDFYIILNNKKEKLEVFQNNEHMAVLTADLYVDDNFKVYLQSKDNKDDTREYNIDIHNAKKYDLTKITKEKYQEHEKLEHNIVSVKGAIKILEKNIEEAEETLKYIDDKIRQFINENEKSNIERFTKAKEEIESELNKYKAEKQAKEQEIQKLFTDNYELEKIFTDIFGELHKH